MPDAIEETDDVLDPILPNLTSHHLNSISWLAVISLTCLLLLTFKNILWLVVPFLLALMLYYTLVPISKRMIRAGFSHSLAAITLCSGFLLVSGVALTLFYPLAIANINSWQHSLIHYLTGGANLVYKLLHNLQARFSFLQHVQFGEDIYLKVDDVAKNFSDKYLGAIVANVAKWLPSLLLAPLISFFLLKDDSDFRKLLGAAVPNAYFEKTLYLIYALDHTAKLYFVGLIKIAIVDTTFMTVGLWLCGVSFNTALLLAFLVAILNWVPYLGPLLGCALVLMVVATDYPSNINIIYTIIGLFIALRLLDDFISLPMILGKSLHIHPFITIIMFIIGEAIAGVAGLMLVIPILAILMVLAETTEIIMTDKRLQARHKHTQKLSWRIANEGLVK